MDDLLDFLSPPVSRGVSRTPGVFKGVKENKELAYDSLNYRRSYPKRSTDYGHRLLRPNTLVTSKPFEKHYTRTIPSIEEHKPDCLDFTNNKRRRSKKIQTSTSNLENSIDRNSILLLQERIQNQKIYQIATSSNTVLKKRISFHDNDNREDLKLLIRSLDMDKSRHRDHQIRFSNSNTSLVNDIYSLDAHKPVYADEVELRHGHGHNSPQKCCECERRRGSDRKDFLQDIGPIKLHLPNSSNCRLESFSLNSPKNHLQIHGKIGLDHNDQYVLKCAATLDDKPIRTNCDDKGFRFPNVPQANYGRLSNSNRQTSRDVPIQVVCPAFEDCRKRNESRGIQVDSKNFSNFQDEATQYSNMNLSPDANANNTTGDNDNNNSKSPLVVISVYHNKNAIVQENVLSENLEATLTSKTIKQSKAKVTHSARSKSPSTKVFNKSSSKSIKNSSAKSSRSPSPAAKRKSGNQTRESNNSNTVAKSRSPSPNQKNTHSARKTSNERKSNSSNCCTNCDQCKESKSKGTASKTNIDKKVTKKTETSSKVTNQQRSFKTKQQITTVQQVTSSKKQTSTSTSSGQNRQQSPPAIGKQHGSAPTANVRQRSPNKIKATLRQNQGNKLKTSYAKTTQRDPYGLNVKDVAGLDDDIPTGRYLYTKRDTITCPSIAHSKHLNNIVPAKSAECVCELDTNNFPQRDMVKKELVDSYMKLYDAQGCNPYFTENMAKKPSEIMISINPGNEQLDLCVKKDEHKKELTINRTRLRSFDEDASGRRFCNVDTCENLRKLNAEGNKYGNDNNHPYFEFAKDKDPNKHYPGDRCPINDPSERDKEIRHLLGVDLRRTDRMVQVDNKHKAQKVQEFAYYKYYNRQLPVTFDCLLAQGEFYQNKVPGSDLKPPKKYERSKENYEVTQVQSTNPNKNTLGSFRCFNHCHPRRKLKSKSITLSRREYIKVKQAIQYSLAKRPKGRDWKSQRKTYSDISVSKIKSIPKPSKVHSCCDEGTQTDKKSKRNNSSKAATKNSLKSDNKKVQANINIVSKHKKSKRYTNREDKSHLEHKDSKLLLLYSAQEKKRNRKDETQSIRRKLSKEYNYNKIEKEVYSNYANNSRSLRKVMSSIEVRYASVAFMKKITISSMVVNGSQARTSIETNIGDTPRPLGAKTGSSILTLFKFGHHKKSVTPNLGLSAVSLYPDGGSECTDLRSDRDKQAEKARKPFLRRLMSCLVIKSKSNKKIMRIQSALTTEAPSSWDSYGISSSFAGMEVTSSMYDTSVSFYSSHRGINPISSKTKRSFFSSVREMLTKKNF